VNLLASPWSELVERTAIVLGKKSLRTPLVALVASMLLATIGNSTIAAQVAQASQNEAIVSGERAALDRELVAAHVRERRLKSDIALVRRIAAIERNDRRMLESVAAVANATPKSVWFVALTIDRRTLTIQAKTDSFAAITTMLRATSQQHLPLLPRVRSVLRSADVVHPILAFTMEIQQTPRAVDRGLHDRT